MLKSAFRDQENLSKISDLIFIVRAHIHYIYIYTLFNCLVRARTTLREGLIEFTSQLEGLNEDLNNSERALIEISRTQGC